jgi:hypothetical protein
MAEVTLASASERQTWSTQYLAEYNRESGFLPYMGRRQTAIFRILSGNETGGASVINVPLLGRLKGRGVEGSEVLEGNEEDLENFNDQIRTTWRRNGVVVPKSTSYRTEINLLNAAKPALNEWAANKTRDQIIAALGSIIIPGDDDENGLPGTDMAKAYASATAAERNAYLVNNADRILFGALRSNASSNVWATALGNIDSTNDKMTVSLQRKAKRMAKNADPHIRPFRTEDGREYFVHLMGSSPFRDLDEDPVMVAANTNARERGLSNPIFQDGDLIYKGVISHEIPELDSAVIEGAGAGGVDVHRTFLLGQSAVGIGWEQQPTPRSDPDRDYGFRPGVAVEELIGMKKLSRGGINYGVVEVLVAATADL